MRSPWSTNAVKTRMPDIASSVAHELDVHHGFNGHNPADIQMLCLTEEAGECAGAYRRWIGGARRSGSRRDFEEELADVVIVAYVLAHYTGTDLPSAIYQKLQKIYSRGWQENHEEGRL